VSSESISPWPDEDLGETWESRAPATPRGGAPLIRLHAAQRLFQDRLAGAAPAEDLTLRMAERLEEFAAELASYQVPEVERWDGWRPDLPGRGHALLPPYVIEHETESTLTARVTFTRFFLGGNGAAHGGAQPLLFDDLLGRVVNHHGVGVARTAYLKVNYRSITPIDEELQAEVSVDRIEGRKRWCSGRLTRRDGTLLADVDALFLQLLPGQP
jgi:acyl-coenzyme A thioesterase PaaI-like protein